MINSIDDTIIAIAGGIILFLLPAGNGKGKGILVWEDATKLPWGIILLFGGGMALADAFDSSGLVPSMLASSLSTDAAGMQEGRVSRVCPLMTRSNISRGSKPVGG